MRYFLTPPPCRNTCKGRSYVSLALDLELLYLNDIPTWPWHIYTGLRVVALGGVLFFQEKRSHKKHILPHSLVHAPILWITFPAEIFVAKVSFRLKSWGLKNSLIKIESKHHKIKHFVMWNLSNFCIFTEIHIHQQILSIPIPITHKLPIPYSCPGQPLVLFLHSLFWIFNKKIINN